MAIIFLICSFFSLLPLSQSVDFTIDSFRVDTTNILYLGDAVPNVGTIEFNKVNYINRVGQAIYYASVPIWDRKTSKLTDFTTHFTFTIDTQGRSPYGNGFTFFLAPLSFQIPPNSAGGFLGLFNTTYTDSPGNQMLVIEFDSFVNPEWDPPFEHVGINKNSIRSANYTAWDASLNSGNSTDAWVSYNSTTQVLNLRWNYGAETDAPANMNTTPDLPLKMPMPSYRIKPDGSEVGSGSSLIRWLLKIYKYYYNKMV
ncbi:hypothetical protein QVD17_36900 [Tagetes erecta]|uniref:Legume lectin domain-containing protein n=1 Tax=Tagetes erecta TaxID=13708 RepID=A0AAD8JT99_TARER|nr:hypothetical protein QVD17_36900 [Tagetes erecta]